MLTTDDLKKLRGVIKQEIDKRVEGTELKMELRFNAIDKRFEKIERQVNHKFDAVEKQMEEDRKDR